MSNDTSILNLYTVYTVELLIFSAILLLLVRTELKTPILVWISANFLAVIEIAVRTMSFQKTENSSISITIFFLSASSALVRYYSVIHDNKSSRRPNNALLVIFIIWTICFFIEDNWLSSFLAYSAGAALLLLTAWEAHRNTLWKRLKGLPIVIAGFIVCAVAVFWRGTVFVASRSGGEAMINVVPTHLGMVLIIIASLMLQIGFVSLVAGYDLRRRRRIDRKNAEALEINFDLAEDQLALETADNERLDMISLLSHEVRQPINSAQAALEALALETKGSTQADIEMRDAITRAQSVLDGITLSISNAILGVSWIDNKQAITTFSLDAVEIAELALSDCPAEHRHRIHLHSAAPSVFSNLDPVLIRLALRNLFDNALKYSPSNTAVHVEIAQDEKRLGASIKVSNQINDAAGLNDDMFGHRVRGGKGDVEGSGHGLFLVKKVALAHSGTISYNITDGRQVTFDLFIPDCGSA